jgi:recombinational DNA repair protein (RecF pathway)
MPDKEKSGADYKNGITSCITCGEPIDERMRRTQGGRCDQCWGLSHGYGGDHGYGPVA